MRLPPELLEKIVDRWWHDITVNTKTGFYLNLMLVNKDFHAVLSRRRGEIMRTQAIALKNCTDFEFLNRFKKPLRNPLVDPKKLLVSMLSQLDVDDSTLEFTRVAPLINENRQLFNALMESCSPPVIFVGHEDGPICSSSEGIKLDARVYLFKNIVAVGSYGSFDVWEYGIFECEALYLFDDTDNSAEIEYCEPIRAIASPSILSLQP
ncbi:hypothetical protein DFJ77DRAFT_469178 [Powellomyces hirtus]|nr:hypothetical protein DFJ77DRAFT_469178 [Powellomyces hirtus]